MTSPPYDALLFLRLAGSRTGVRGTHIPLPVITMVANLGGQVRFESGRIYVRNSRTLIARVREICGNPVRR